MTSTSFDPDAGSPSRAGGDDDGVHGDWEHLFLAAPMPASVSRRSDGTLLAVNDAWVRLTGLTREAALGRTTVELGHWETRSSREDYVARLLRHEAFETTLGLGNGLPRRVRLHTTATRYRQEDVLLVYLEDITQAHESELALWQANQSLQRQVELAGATERMAHVGYWINAAADADVLWSPGLFAIAGMAPRDVLSKAQGRGGIHADDMPAWLAARQALDEREVEFRWTREDGRKRWFRTRIGRIQVGGQAETDFGVVQDITEEKAAAIESAQQLHFIRHMAARVPGLIYQVRVDADGHTSVVYASEACRDIFELEPRDVLASIRPVLERIHPDDLPDMLLTLGKAGTDLSTWRHRFRVNLPRRGLRWCQAEAVPERTDEDAVIWYGFLSDVTQEIRAQERLQRQHRMLEAVRHAQSLYIEADDKRKVFEGLLTALLTAADSAYGFVGEVLHDSDGQPYMKAYALTDISWDEASRNKYRQEMVEGLEFHNLDTLFGHALRTGEVVIANDVANDPRASGTPPGHPPLRTFLGVPLKAGDQLVALIGLANQPGGYSKRDVEFLQPVLGTVRQLVLAWREHMERRRAREQLQATGELLSERTAALQLTFDSMSQGLVMVDAEGRIRFHNRRLLELLDLPEALLASQPHYKEVVAFQTARGDFGENFALVEASVRPLIGREPEVPPPPRYFRHTQDGKVLEIATRQLDDGGMVRTYSDVTSFADAESALREERQRLQWVLEATRPGIWESNLETRDMKINARWAEMLGYTVDELMPTTIDTWRRLVHPVDLQRAQRLLDQHWAGESPYYECDIRMRHKSGRWLWINDRGRVHRRDAQGRALYMSGTHLDIHERVEAQEEVRALNATLERRVAERTAELERSVRDVESISYSIAHDLRAPLRVVNGFTGLILDEESERLSPNGREMFERIQRSSRNMGAMISDMLELLRVVQADLQMVPVDMTALARAALDSVVPHDLPIEVDLQSLPGAKGDPTLLRQVMTNLLDNALKYSRHRDVPRLQVGFDPGRQAYFVRDNGMGFDMARAQKLFGLFQRLHTGGNVPGTGIGLAIVARIIERHGGRIWAESRPDEGACFWWTLPQA
ncbi:MAG: PAS domain-containing protein [Burkholderiaceae bacterium]